MFRIEEVIVVVNDADRDGESGFGGDNGCGSD
jgi:hypothetical protein